MGKEEKAERKEGEDWTRKERRMRWKLEKIARMEERKGNKM